MKYPQKSGSPRSHSSLRFAAQLHSTARSCRSGRREVKILGRRWSRFWRDFNRARVRGWFQISLIFMTALQRWEGAGALTPRRRKSWSSNLCFWKFQPNPLDRKIESFDKLTMRKIILTLFGRGGGILCPPYHIFVYICAITRTSALKKLDFSRLWVWKRAIHFLPFKVILFRWKKIKFVGNTKIS